MTGRFHGSATKLAHFFWNCWQWHSFVAPFFGQCVVIRTKKALSAGVSGGWGTSRQSGSGWAEERLLRKCIRIAGVCVLVFKTPRGAVHAPPLPVDGHWPTMKGLALKPRCHLFTDLCRTSAVQAGRRLWLARLPRRPHGKATLPGMLCGSDCRPGRVHSNRQPVAYCEHAPASKRASMITEACARGARQAKTEGLLSSPHLEHGGTESAEQGLSTALLRADIPH